MRAAEWPTPEIADALPEQVPMPDLPADVSQDTFRSFRATRSKGPPSMQLSNGPTRPRTRSALVGRHEVDVLRELDDRRDVVAVEFAELVHRHRHRLDTECGQSLLHRRDRERLLCFGVQPIDDGARGL